MRRSPTFVQGTKQLPLAIGGLLGQGGVGRMVPMHIMARRSQARQRFFSQGNRYSNLARTHLRNASIIWRILLIKASHTHNWPANATPEPECSSSPSSQQS